MRMSHRDLGATFWRFWSGSAVSQLGDGLRITALPLLAASLTRDPLPVAVVGAAVWLPWLVFGVVGGAIVDRVDRRSLMRNVQVVRMLVMASLVAAVILGFASIPVLAVAAFLIGLGEVLVDSALYSVVPRLVSEGRLEAANGRLGAGQLVGNELAGPPIGALMFGVTHWLPFAADALSFGTSAAVLQSVNADFKAESEDRIQTSIWHEVREGVAWLAGHRVLGATTLGLGAVNIGAGGWAVLVLFALEILDVTGLGFGLLISATAIGGVIGSFIAERVVQVLGRSRGMLWPSGIAAGHSRNRRHAERFRCGNLHLHRGVGRRRVQRHRPLSAASSDARSVTGAGHERTADVQLRDGRRWGHYGGLARGSLWFKSALHRRRRDHRRGCCIHGCLGERAELRRSARSGDHGLMSRPPIVIPVHWMLGSGVAGSDIQ